MGLQIQIKKFQRILIEMEGEQLWVSLPDTVEYPDRFIKLIFSGSQKMQIYREKEYKSGITNKKLEKQRDGTENLYSISE